MGDLFLFRKGDMENSRAGERSLNKNTASSCPFWRGPRTPVKMTIDMDYREDDLTEKIIGCIIKVHKALGPGFQEIIYHKALLIEFQKKALTAFSQQEAIVTYDGCEIGRHRFDLVVEGKVILELKTVENLAQAHYAQVRSYLKVGGFPVALLVNFSKATPDYRRIEV